ncbi:MAG: caspase family protein [Polyangiales bacterium]
MKRALVLGSQTPPLEGVNRDALRVAARLEGLGFEVDLRTDAKATRAGILDGYARVTADAGPDDAVVIYYSGHGSYEEVIEVAGADGVTRRARYQGIVPFDYAESTEGDFRGLLAEELSVLLDGVTQRTRNVAVLLDCCHAGMMSRRGGLRVKSVAHPVRVGVLARLDELARAPRARAVLGRPHNPLAVRLAAARTEQSAYEYEGDDGEMCGVFTESLLIALDEASGREVTWRDVGRRVQDRVLQRCRGQQAEIEGPADRVVFDLRERAPLDDAAIDERDGLWRLRRGRIFGVRAGDVYAVRPPPTAKDEELGRVRVTRVEAREAEVAFVSGRPSAVPEGARAREVERAEPPRVVWVPEGSESRDAVAGALAAEERLTVSATLDPGAAPLATVRVEGGLLSLTNQDGAPMLSPAPLADALPKLARNLLAMAHAQAMRELEGEGLAGVRDEDFAVTWGVRGGDGARDLPPAGATVGHKAEVDFRLKNRSARDLYVHLFNVGVSEAVTLISGPLYPTGFLLRAGADVPMFDVGVECSWPGAVPADVQRAEEWLFVVTARPTDLAALEQGGVRRSARGGTRLERLVRQARAGVTRQSDPVRGGDDFLTRRIRYFMSPWPDAAQGGGFLVDDRRSAMEFTPRPPRAAARGALEGVSRAPVKRPATPRIAVELLELVVHKNRAMFGADLRVDALFIAPQASGTAYSAGTMRFPGVKDGDRLPLDQVLLCMASPREFVDVCLWVSRDRGGSLALADLLAAEANSAEVKGALGALGALAVAAPQAAAVVGAAGAAATLAAVGYRLLSKAVGDSVGVYRTTLLAADGFRVGRIPAEGTLRAQDFSFALRVRAVA